MMNGGAKRPPKYEVLAVRKALEVLCEFRAEVPAFGASDLSRRLDMPKSTTHNLLRTLESLDFLRQDQADRRYRLGPRVYELGLRFAQETRLVSAALPHLRRLAEDTKETVKLGILSDREVLILAAVESPYQLHTRGDEGRRAPLHCTGLGKAILATLPAEEVREIVARKGLPRLTPHTIVTLPELEEELERIRRDGYTLDREENELGVMCVAAAVEDRTGGSRAALSVSAPTSRMAEDRMRGCSKLVWKSARAVEQALGSCRTLAGPAAEWRLGRRQGE